MPKGVYDRSTMKTTSTKAPVVAAPIEPFHVIEERLATRFFVLEEIVDAAISGDARAVIVSGPGGLGKSFTVEKKLQEWDPERINHTIVKGYIKATGLYRLAWKHRDPGQVIVMDDADSIFADETALGILKAMCDTTETRRVGWHSEGVFFDEDSAENIPRDFEFNGTVIFISNKDFDAELDSKTKLAPHMEALISRSHYIDLAMKTKRDYLVRIRQVVALGMLKDHGLTPKQEDEVMEYIEVNMDTMRELSLRMALKLAALRRTKPKTWLKVADVTCRKGVR